MSTYAALLPVELKEPPIQADAGDEDKRHPPYFLNTAVGLPC